MRICSGKQVTIHILKQCRQRSLTSFGVTRSQNWLQKLQCVLACGKSQNTHHFNIQQQQQKNWGWQTPQPHWPEKAPNQNHEKRRKIDVIIKPWTRGEWAKFTFWQVCRFGGLGSRRYAWYRVIVMVTAVGLLLMMVIVYTNFCYLFWERKVRQIFGGDDKTRTFVNQHVHPYMCTQFDDFNSA